MRYRLMVARAAIARNFALLLTFAAVLAGIFTFLLMSGSSGVTTDPDLILALLALDLALLLALGALDGAVQYRDQGNAPGYQERSIVPVYEKLRRKGSGRQHH